MANGFKHVMSECRKRIPENYLKMTAVHLPFISRSSVDRNRNMDSSELIGVAPDFAAAAARLSKGAGKGASRFLPRHFA